MVFVLHFKCIDDFAREAVAREVVYSDKLKKKNWGGGGWGRPSENDRQASMNFKDETCIN